MKTIEIKDERVAKLLLKEINRIEAGDVTDTYHYIQLLLANQEEVVNQLDNNNWKISNQFNAKKGTYRHVGFIHTYTDYDFTEDENGEEVEIEQIITKQMVHTYVIDGNGHKRIATKSSQINWVDYQVVTLEEIQKELTQLKEQCQALLPHSTPNYHEVLFMKKDDLADYSEKSYAVIMTDDLKIVFGQSNFFIPKSVVAFNSEGQLLLADWYFKKNSQYFKMSI